MSENENKGTRIKVRARPYSVVPDSILMDKSLSTTARLTLAYMIGRGQDWVFYVRQVQAALGLSESRWSGARRELEAGGYLKQIRRQGTAGRWVWELEVYDTPTTTIPGNSIPGKSMNGKPIHGKMGDITEDLKQSDVNITLETEEEEREEPRSGSQALSIANPKPSPSPSPSPSQNPNPNPKAVSRGVVGDKSWSLPTAWRDFARKERQDLSEKQIDHLFEKFRGYYSGTGTQVNDRLLVKWKGWVMREVVQAAPQQRTGFRQPRSDSFSQVDYGQGGKI